MPVSIDCWNIKVRNGAIAGAASFSIRTGMRSGPVALDGLIFSRSFMTPLWLIAMFRISGNSLCLTVGNIGFSLVKTQVYGAFSTSAFKLGSVISTPFGFRMGMPTESLRLALTYCQKRLMAGFLLFAPINCQYYPQLENRKGYLCIPGEPSSFPYVLLCVFA